VAGVDPESALEGRCAMILIVILDSVESQHIGRWFRRHCTRAGRLLAQRLERVTLAPPLVDADQERPQPQRRTSGQARRVRQSTTHGVKRASSGSQSSVTSTTRRIPTRLSPCSLKGRPCVTSSSTSTSRTTGTPAHSAVPRSHKRSTTSCSRRNSLRSSRTRKYSGRAYGQGRTVTSSSILKR
jgi:hypothetical protein